MNKFIESEPEHWFSVTGMFPIFIFPARIFGGHELMAVEIIKAITALGANVRAYIDPVNDKLFSALSIINNVKTSYLPFSQPRFEFIHSLINPIYRFKADAFINSILKNDLNELIFVQGDIELGCLYSLAALRANISFSSYIPFTHMPSVMGKPLAWFRDRFSRDLYKKTKRYITISAVFADELSLLSPGCRVALIRNRVRDLSKYSKLRSDYFLRQREEGDRKGFNIAIIGRISYRQKGHDLLLDALSGLEPCLQKRITLHVIGDGEDSDDFKRRCERFSGRTHFYGWQKEPWSIAFLSDLLVIPSRFEGVPLVMLEAMELGVEVIATGRDGMLEYLPESSLFIDSHGMRQLIHSTFGRIAR